MIPIDVLLSEERIADDFLAALAHRHLPEKFFYWMPLSVKAWLELCRSTAYKNFARSLELVAAQASRLVEQVRGNNLEVVSLGSGQGDKDIRLLEALRQGGRKVFYRPVDSSQALLEIACARAIEARIPTRGLKADLMNSQHVRGVKDDAQSPRLFLLLGNTLGGLEPLEFVSHLAQLIAPGDFLLVDGEIYSGADTMAGYDNPVNRNFASAPLRSIGIGEEDGELRFEITAEPRREGLYLIRKGFRFGRAREVVVAGQRLRFEAGETIAMSSSYKYAPPAFLELVRQEMGLEVMHEALSEDQRFLMVLAARSNRK